jgi:hypothetical protein
MSTQRVPLEALQKIRQYLKAALVLPESENCPLPYTKEPPQPDSIEGLGNLFHFGSIAEETAQLPNSQGQWFISTINPGSVFLKLPGLALKPDFRLVSYLYRIGDDGRGTILAIPTSLSTTAHLEKALLASEGSEAPPRPEGVLPDFMSAIAGDGSSMACVIASLLRREFLEFGALGKKADWSHHRLMAALPAQVQWQWRIDPVKDLSPKVHSLSDGRIAIEFFTCRTVAPIAIFQHVDQYSAEDYQAKRLDRAIAIAQKTN